MDVTIRAAEPGEEAALVPLYEWLFETPRGPVRPAAWDPRRAEVALRQAIDSHDSVVLVAELAGAREAEEAAGDPARADAGAEDESPSHRRGQVVSAGADATAGDPAAPGREAEGAAGGHFVGICTAYQDLHSVRFGYRAWVEDLVVGPEHRSRGVGSALLRAAREWARERGATHLELDTAEWREGAQRFYERERPGHRSISYSWEL